ncbi:MAG: S1 family peptidase [Actinomycetota bacterium]|nr:S1 family peptidase [Actinomycetota bacterium]
MVIMGGGAVIVVNDNSFCTLTTIGRDRAGDVVGFTAAQCGGPGAAVAVAGTDTTVGTVVAANADLDYAVIKFDAPDLIPVSDYAGVAINGLGPDPVSDSRVCKWGPANPGSCYGIRHDGWRRMQMYGWFDGGDVGAPVTMDGLLVGMVVGGGITWGGKVDPLIADHVLDEIQRNPGRRQRRRRTRQRIRPDRELTGWCGSGRGRQTGMRWWPGTERTLMANSAGPTVDRGRLPVLSCRY